MSAPLVFTLRVERLRRCSASAPGTTQVYTNARPCHFEWSVRSEESFVSAYVEDSSPQAGFGMTVVAKGDVLVGQALVPGVEPLHRSD